MWISLEMYSEPCQTLRMEIFTKIVNKQKYELETRKHIHTTLLMTGIIAAVSL